MMPWKNNRELIKNVDLLPHSAGWRVQALKIQGDRGEEVLEMWMRDALEEVKRILKNKHIGQFMEIRPVRKWTSPARTERCRDEMNTADWMWEIQVSNNSGICCAMSMYGTETYSLVKGRDHGPGRNHHPNHYLLR
jgi:hypothetical protein